MSNVNVSTDKTTWGVTHIVSGKKEDVTSWCKNLACSTGYRVHCREIEANDDGTVTYRADVDSNCVAQAESRGPGFFTCVAIGLGLGFLFGG
jgi:hypothetical protein